MDPKTLIKISEVVAPEEEVCSDGARTKRLANFSKMTPQKEHFVAVKSTSFSQVGQVFIEMGAAAILVVRRCSTRDEFLVLLFGHQGIEFGGVGHFDGEDPALVVWGFIDQAGVGF